MFPLDPLHHGRLDSDTGGTAEIHELRTQRGREPGPEGPVDVRQLRIQELETKIAGLEGALGRKGMELDFFAGALRRIAESRQKSETNGATASTRKSAATGAVAQSAADVRGAAPVVPLSSQPPAKIIVDQPMAEPLSRGLVVIQYYTENLHIAPVYGPAALAVSPRVGHLHLTVDNLPWHWLDASGEPITIKGLPAGPHKILVELADANQKVLASQTVLLVNPKVEKSGPDYK